MAFGPVDEDVVDQRSVLESEGCALREIDRALTETHRKTTGPEYGVVRDHAVARALEGDWREYDVDEDAAQHRDVASLDVLVVGAGLGAMRCRRARFAEVDGAVAPQEPAPAQFDVAAVARGAERP
jgi:hypothetical protein